MALRLAKMGDDHDWYHSYMEVNSRNEKSWGKQGCKTEIILLPLNHSDQHQGGFLLLFVSLSKGSIETGVVKVLPSQIIMLPSSLPHFLATISSIWREEFFKPSPHINPRMQLWNCTWLSGCLEKLLGSYFIIMIYPPCNFPMRATTKTAAYFCQQP